MSEYEGANVTEAAEPSETQDAKEPEVVETAEEPADEQGDTTEATEENEPEEQGEENADEQDSKTNAAFAEQRRRIEELERELKERDEAKEQAEKEAEEQAELEQQIESIVNYAREQGLEDSEIEDILEDFREDYEKDKEIERLQSEIDRLNDEIVSVQLEQLARNDLATVQEIDPNIKDLDTLGEEFFALRAQGIEPKRAYYMLKAADERTKPHGAYAPGKVNRSKQESEYYTSEELDNLTDAEMEANWEKVMRSMNRL